MVYNLGPLKNLNKLTCHHVFMATGYMALFSNRINLQFMPRMSPPRTSSAVPDTEMLTIS